MHLTRYDEIAAYAERAVPFLAAHEAVHCLQLGICETLRHQAMGPVGDAPPYLATVERDDGSVAAVILRTPPHNVVLSLMDAAERDAALALAADDLGAVYGEMPGALGPTEIVAAFAAHWQARRGRLYHIPRHERIYQLERVLPVHGVAGRFRPVAQADRAVLIDWLDAFQAEAMPGVNEYDACEFADRMIAGERRGAFLWEDGEHVSLAAYGNPTPHGIRVGPVYTPPEHRGHGYASACVAALSQMLLDEGRQFVFLFTDLANPTSNHIYQSIGYAPVCDVDEYRFGPPA
jgi:hypothetical protein